MAIILPPKDPDEIIDYGLNWEDRLAGDTIVTSEWATEGGDVIVGVTSYTPTTTTVWLSGGTLGEKCIIRNRVTTLGNRTMDQSISVKIKTK